MNSTLILIIIQDKLKKDTLEKLLSQPACELSNTLATIGDEELEKPQPPEIDELLEHVCSLFSFLTIFRNM